MDYVKSRFNVYTPVAGSAEGSFESMFCDLLIESGPTKDGGFLSLTLFNSKDGTKTPVGQLSNIIKKDSKSLKVSVYDLSSLYLLRTYIESTIAVAEKVKKESVLAASKN